MRPFLHDPDWTPCSLAGTCERLDRDLNVRRFTVPLRASGRRPFRLAFFADLHWDGEPARRLRRLVAAVNAAAVDVVLFGGDLSADLLHLPDALCQLAALQARCACLAVRGNRESACSWLPREFWRERYARAGFLYLENEIWVPADDPDGPAIAGFDDERHGIPDLGLAAVAAQSGRAVVALTHNPDLIGCRSATFLGELVLSGHTHGGQYRVPGIGALFTSSRYGRQFDHGWRRRRDGTLLYITTGVGATGPGLLRRRLFCPPELILLTLVNAAGKESA